MDEKIRKFLNVEIILFRCLWREVFSQQRIRHFKILQSIYFAYEEGIISSYSNRMSSYFVDIFNRLNMLRSTLHVV